MSAYRSLAQLSFGLVVLGAAHRVYAQEPTPESSPPPDSASIDVDASVATEPAPLPEVTAEPTLAPELGDAVRRIVLGLHTGSALPLNKLAVGFTLGLDFGYILAVADDRLEVALSPTYGGHERSFTDGEYAADADLTYLRIDLGLRARFLPLGGPLNAYGWLGGAVLLTRSESSGSRGQESFAEFTEESTEFGVVVGLGAEYLLGPGAVHVDLGTGWTPLDHQITGSTSSAFLSLQAGYRFFF